MLKKAFCLLVSICQIFTGCSSGGIKTYTISAEEMPSNFDPQIASAPREITVITNIFDGLFDIVEGQTVNNLATDCTVSRDGKTYTVKIKEDAMYNYRNKGQREYDGTPVKAEDFVFALQRVLSPSTHSPYAEDFINIKNAAAVQSGASPEILGVSAPDEHTLVIQLEKADFSFKEKLAMTAAYPCNRDFFVSCGGAYGLSIETILSNGPFRLNYLDTEGGNATIVRVRDEGRNTVDRIRLVQTEPGGEAQSYADGRISGYFSYASQEENTSGASALEFESSNICLVFNPSVPALAQRDTRRALGWYAYGFKNSGANMAAVTATDSLFPGTVTLDSKSVSASIDQSRPFYMNLEPKSLLSRGLNRAGLEKIPALKVLMPSDSIYTIIFENINQMWQRDLNRFFTVEYLPTSQLRQRVLSGEYDLAFMPLTPSNSTPYGILDLFAPLSSDIESYVNMAKNAQSAAGALRYIGQREQNIISRAYAVPMGSEKTIYYHASNFKDISIDPFTGVINLKYAQAN